MSFSQKGIVTNQKDAQGKPVMRSVNIANEVYRERYIVANGDGLKEIPFFQPTLPNANFKRNYQPGSQNLFKNNVGFVLKVDFEVYDTEGNPLFVKVTKDGLPDKIRKLQKLLSTARVIHKDDEDKRIIDAFKNYWDEIPDIYELITAGASPSDPPAEWKQIELHRRHRDSHPFTKSKDSGYEYPKQGLALNDKKSWSVILELDEVLPAECNGMEIHSIVYGQRVVDVKGK